MVLVTKFRSITFSLSSTGPGHAKMCLMACANNKGADQPGHPRSLISTFFVHCVDSMLCMAGRIWDLIFWGQDMGSDCISSWSLLIFLLCYIQSFKFLASFCSWADWFESYLVENLRRHIFAWCGSIHDYRLLANGELSLWKTKNKHYEKGQLKSFIILYRSLSMPSREEWSNKNTYWIKNNSVWPANRSRIPLFPSDVVTLTVRISHSQQRAHKVDTMKTRQGRDNSHTM